MTRLELRGWRWFVFFATLIVAERLIGIAAGIALAESMSEIRWMRSVIQPLLVIGMVACLATGDNWIRWMTGLILVMTGSMAIYGSARLLFGLSDVISIQEPDAVTRMVVVPTSLVFAFGLFDLIAGLSFLSMPSVQAFFRHQRQPRVEFTVV